MNLGGAQRVMSHLVAHLATKHDVTLMTWESAATSPFFSIPKSVHLIRADLLGGRGLVRLMRLLPRPFRIRAAIRCQQPDIVLSFMDTMNITALLAAYKSDIPVIVSERTDPEHHMIGPLWRFLRRITYPWAALCVVQTSKIERFCARIPGAKTVICPNPIPRTHLCAQPDRPDTSGRYTIIALGRLSKEKGYGILLSAFARIAERHPLWDLVILGDGPQRAELESLVSIHDLSSRVSMPGAASNPSERLAASHIIAFPSLYEGFPNALAEGMAAGLPAVGNASVSGVEDLIHHERTGLLISPKGNAEALARALDRLISNPSDRRHMGYSARELVEQWSPEKVLEKWDGLISDATRASKADRNERLRDDST